MTYRIARNGEIYGPYTLLQLQRHLASGHVVGTDLAQSDVMDEWLPVADLFPASPMKEEETPDHPGGLPRLFPNPPDLNWIVLLVLEAVTLNMFSVAWDLYEAIWMRRVDRGSIAVWFYGASALLFIVKVPGTWHSILYNLGRGPMPEDGWPAVFTMLTVLLAIASRLVFRGELLRHFNRAEPIGLGLNWFLSLLFGGLYFQYHFNRINEVKRALRVSVP